MSAVHRVDDDLAAAALANLLNGNSRKRPVVVVTIPAGRTDPWIDVEEVAREAGSLADVYLMPTGPFTWDFSDRMAAGTQVYGGAGRVYPVGHEWASDLSKSPLRFAFNEDDGDRATQKLISDMLRMAAAAGLLQSVPTRELRKVDTTVKMVVAGRALVDVGNLFPAAIAEELAVDDVPIDRIVEAGLRIEGWYDADSNRVDIRQSLRRHGEALAAYAVGDVVLSKVAKVRNGKAELVLYPQTTTPPVVVTVLRADVTANPEDDLRTLMTVGEVIPARVTATGPNWALALHDVDDDEPIVSAPSLLPGGPPWLSEEPDHSEVDEPKAVTSLPMPPPAPTPVQVIEAPSPTQPPAAATPRPSPAMLDRSRPGPSQRPASASPAPHRPTESTRGLLLKVDGLTAEIAGLKREVVNLQTQVLAGSDEREQLRYLLDQAERRANKAENDLKSTRARLRKATSTGKSESPAGNGPRFADPEQEFRYLVLTQWATRTLPSEQRNRPLADFIIGPRFLESLERLQGIKPEKVADVAFEIVTGLAPQLPSREVHHLRAGPGGDDPVRVRDDGAIAWRASLQVNTPSARRIHYWVLPTGQIELARVATHDDFEI
ncbi:hypothetical protein F4692_003777 [Nocardioides cavernae]|uniref:S1 motif domain-containing protein n=1 Tax=Nocardioides cavernae TaxID=1921566 RepID=A0A7Y9H653_9ACTN|nr:hypothetical protein [Nocardioides cavernae]NYE38627.1 hypothetical protein [Nocardioides cavernae]